MNNTNVNTLSAVKKNKFASIILVVCIVLGLTIVGCIGYTIFFRYWRMSNCPSSQPNTQWISEDESIILYVNDEGFITGTINYRGEIIKVRIHDFSYAMYIYDIKVDDLNHSEPTDEYYLGEWRCSYKSKKKFVATGYQLESDKNCIFEMGQKITFYRLD